VAETRDSTDELFSDARIKPTFHAGAFLQLHGVFMVGERGHGR
jgi:hypothetical protein